MTFSDSDLDYPRILEVLKQRLDLIEREQIQDQAKVSRVNFLSFALKTCKL